MQRLVRRLEKRVGGLGVYFFAKERWISRRHTVFCEHLALRTPDRRYFLDASFFALRFFAERAGEGRAARSPLSPVF